MRTRGKNVPVVPKVGETWMHDISVSDVYMRIDDEHGFLAVSQMPACKDVDLEDRFFSVNLRNGYVVAMKKNSRDVIIVDSYLHVFGLDKDE